MHRIQFVLLGIVQVQTIIFDINEYITNMYTITKHDVLQIMMILKRYIESEEEEEESTKAKHTISQTHATTQDA